MMKNRAVWVALIVVAAAALLMFFVVLPQMRSDKVAVELAKKAGEAVKQAEDATKKTVEQVEKATEQAAADLKSGALAKVARIKGDIEASATEFEALFAGGKTPTAEQLAATRAKVEAALKAAGDFKAPEGLDAATSAVIATVSEGAGKALEMMRAMPTDAEGARKAFDGVKAILLPAGDGKAPAETKALETDAKADLPAFDVLRVEPDGSTVIAGRAAPGSNIQILDGDKSIASAEAGISGDFVAVLDKPLAGGDHQLVLQATGKDGKKVVSAEVATVSVPVDKSGELLAMVTKPGEASRIMSMPEAKKETVVAEAVKDVKSQEATQTAAAADEKPADKAAATTDASSSSTDTTGNAPAIAADTATAADAVKPADSADQAQDAESAVKAADGAQKPADTKRLVAPEVLVSAVEIEGDKIFVAGSARPKAVVRVYADDKLVAEVPTDENGRFVADNTMPLAVGDHTIRADVLSGDGKKVEFRASVPFFRPEGEQLAAVAGDASTPHTKEMQPLADGAYDKAREEAGKAVGLLKGLYDAGRIPSAEELAAARSATEIALKTLSEMKVADDVDPVAKEIAAKTAGEAAKALALLKSLPQDANAVKTALASIDDAVTSAVAPSMDAAKLEKPVATDKEQAAAANQPDAGQVVEQPGEKVASQGDVVPAGDQAKADSEAASAKPEPAQQADEVSQDKAASQVEKTTEAKAAAEVATTEDQPKVIEQAPLKPSGASVIIRRGDTLWQISRRVYGRGVRYTTIYLANEDQIADPDRIMPGQIFGVPDKPLPNAEELHRQRMSHPKP